MGGRPQRAGDRQLRHAERESLGIELFIGYWEGYKGKGVMEEKEKERDREEEAEVAFSEKGWTERAR